MGDLGQGSVNFSGGGMIMGLLIVLVLVLIGVIIGFGIFFCQAFGDLLGSIGAFKAGCEDEPDAQGLEDILSFPGGIFGQAEGDGDIELFGDMCVGNACIAAGGIQKGTAPGKIAVLYGLADDIVG